MLPTKDELRKLKRVDKCGDEIIGRELPPFENIHQNEDIGAILIDEFHPSCGIFNFYLTMC